MGLVVFAGGCAKPPAKPRPTVVYVNAGTLALEHPLWADVAALDRELAFLGGYAVNPQAGATVQSVREPVIRAEAPSYNVTELERKIEERLGEQYAEQRTKLEARLDRERQAVLQAEARAAPAVAERYEIAQWGADQFERILNKYLLEARNLEIRHAALKSLIDTYEARGWDRDPLPEPDAGAKTSVRKPRPDENRGRVYRELTAQRDDVTARIAAAAVEKKAAMDAVWAELKARFMAKGAGDPAANLRLAHAHSLAMAELDREAATQQRLLSDALQQVGAPAASIAPVRVKVVSTEPRVPAPAPDLPDMGAAASSLRARRDAAARSVLLNTEALVRSEATRRGQQVVFKASPGVTDATPDYRDAVRRSPAALEGSL